MTSLEVLEEIEDYEEYPCFDVDEYGLLVEPAESFMHKMYPEEFDIIRRDLKAFEIMKKNLGASFDCLKYYETAQEWNEEYGDDYPLTNEEFNLLQEVLNEH